MNLKAAPETPKEAPTTEANRSDRLLNTTAKTRDVFSHANNPERFQANNLNDFSVVRNGERCAGVHFIIDVYGATGLGSSKLLKETLLRCVEVADATLLHLHLHNFESSGGISGVAVLAESHISIYTWPEHNFAAIDVFMCGNTKPDACLKILIDAFSPASVSVSEFLRGRLWRDCP